MTRGPSNIPASMASRTATETSPVEPGSQMLVTPARSTFCAFQTARMARYSMGVYRSSSSSVSGSP